MPDAPPPARLLEQITAQQALVAMLERRLQLAERAVGSAVSATAGAAAHRRADDALTVVEAAEDTLRELLAQHAAGGTGTRPGSKTASRRLRAAPAANQDALFDVG